MSHLREGRARGAPFALAAASVIAVFCVVGLLMGCLYMRLWSRAAASAASQAFVLLVRRHVLAG